MDNNNTGVFFFILAIVGVVVVYRLFARFNPGALWYIERRGLVWWWKNRKKPEIAWNIFEQRGHQSDRRALNEALKSLQKFASDLEHRVIYMRQEVAAVKEEKKEFYNHRINRAQKHLSIVSQAIGDLKLEDDRRSRLELVEDLYKKQINGLEFQFNAVTNKLTSMERDACAKRNADLSVALNAAKAHRKQSGYESVLVDCPVCGTGKLNAVFSGKTSCQLSCTSSRCIGLAIYD